MLLLMVYCIFISNAFAENPKRTWPIETGQDIADTFIGAVWRRFAGSEFVGGTASVYQNQKEGQPVVRTRKGLVQGMLSSTSRDKQPYAAFMGIPYAKPPVGSLRFKAPVEPEPWDGILYSGKERHTCMTFREPDKGSEDCLYLNVFSPYIDLEQSLPEPLPVMVFIYGGAFMGGSSNTSGYAPDFLIDKKVILVTFNYRIGPLGFLSLNDKNVPGNAGLKDQTMVLKWVRENIQFFGGDQNRLTIFGESAGAASVGYHLISPLSKGLFDRAIMESGTPIAQWAYTSPETAREKAYHLAHRVGCVLPSTDSQQYLYECLRDAPAKLITRVQFSGLSVEDMVYLKPLAFVPTKEKAGKDAFITLTPLECFQTGLFSKVPIWMGINTFEGLLLYKAIQKIDPTGALIAYVGEDLTKVAPPELTSKSKYTAELHNRIKSFYTKRSGPVNAVTLLEFLKVISDTQFLLPLLQTADYISTWSDQPVYNYLFSYDGPYACYKLTEDIMHIPGTCHMDELGYIFNLGPIETAYNHNNRQSEQEKMIDIMSSMWANFAATGNPSARNDCQPFTKTETAYCDIDVTVSTRKSIMQKEVNFWNSLYQLVLGTRPIPE